MTRITMLVPNISTNCMGRAYILAKVLSRHYKVEIVGPDFGAGIWPPCRAEPLNYTPISSQNYIHFLHQAHQYLAHSDVIYAIKPLMTSYGLALLSKFKYSLPIILDIDDWELGFSYWRIAQSKKAYFKIFSFNWVGWIFLLEQFIKVAHKITVSGNFLQHRYGGYLIPHGRDLNFLNPANFSATHLRQTHHLENKKVILFLGTPKPYKGITDLIKAVQLIPDPTLQIILVGAETTDPYVQSLLNLGESRLKLVGMRPLTEIPEWLSLADVVVIPQQKSVIDVGQTPAKIFDATAMAKPIISTSVGDIPYILADCGFVVPPSDVLALAEKIKFVFQYPSQAQAVGLVAREKCRKEFSWDVMEKRLLAVFSTI